MSRDSANALSLRRQYREALSRARTENQVNKVYIPIVMTYLPHEISEILRPIPLGRVTTVIGGELAGLAARLNKQIRKGPYFWGKAALSLWVVKLRWKMSLLAFEWSPTYRRLEWQASPVAGSTTLYHVGSGSRGLIVVCAPRGGGFIDTTASLLVTFGPLNLDVLLVPAKKRQQTTWPAVEGFSDGFGGLALAVKELSEKYGYRTLHTVGLSFGAQLAFFLGIEMEAQTVTTIGLVRGPEALQELEPALWAKAVKAHATQYNGGNQRITFVCGSQDARDVSVAEQMSRFFVGSTVFRVKDADHNPLVLIAEKRRLSAFFAQMVDGFSERPTIISALSPVSVDLKRS
jgi:hypothetical protein